MRRGMEIDALDDNFQLSFCHTMLWPWTGGALNGHDFNHDVWSEFVIRRSYERVELHSFTLGTARGGTYSAFHVEFGEVQEIRLLPKGGFLAK